MGEGHPAAIENALISRVAEGDHEALRSLYDRTAPRLLQVAEIMLGEGSEAEDVVQDVFVSLWRKADSFDPARSSARTWLVAVVRHRAIDRLRRRGARPLSVGDARDVEHAGRPAETGEDETLERRSTIAHALGRLTPHDAALLRAAYMEGLTYEELARREAVPVGTVKSRVARSLRRLREEIEP